MGASSCWKRAADLDSEGNVLAALELCLSPAGQREPDCQRYIGWHFASRGEFDRALTAYLAAANMGSEAAQIECAKVIAKFEATAGTAKAIQLCEAAPYRDFIGCQRFLVRAFLRDGEMDAVLQWAQRVAEHGSADDILYVGELYEWRKDWKQALRRFEDALKAGSERAFHMIGDAHLLGQGTPKNAAASIPYFQQSAKFGFIYGKLRLLQAEAIRGGVISNLRFFLGVPTLLIKASYLHYLRPNSKSLMDMRRARIYIAPK